MAGEFQVSGDNADAPFTLKVHRGDGMALVAMDWKEGKPWRSFVGFAIEYMEPGGDHYYPLKNRLAFPGADGSVDPNRYSTMRSPIQKFRWVHFPRNAELRGEFKYRVTPVFMNEHDELSYGEAQTAAIELRRETYPGQLNVCFTRGYVLSQRAFVDRYKTMAKLLPPNADAGLKFKATHPDAEEALPWMGFEARDVILDLLDEAIADKKAQVRVVAYDLSEPEVVNRLRKLKARLRIIIDDSASHGEAHSGESQAAKLLRASGADVKRQHMGQLQHNKTIAVDGPKVEAVVCGSTNFSWRGFYVQSNNTIELGSRAAVDVFVSAFDDYWAKETPGTFGKTASARWQSLGLDGINAKVAFSPHVDSNALLEGIAEDVAENTKSSLLYSLAFLHQTPGAMQNAIKKVMKIKGMFVYGISDKKVGGLDLQKPDGTIAPVYPKELAGKNVPEPFKSEPKGGGGNRMHHKFLVVDFDKPTARVYMGSYNFSSTADTKNGENLLLIRDRRIAVSYAIEAIRIFDHYHFRVAQAEAKSARKKLQLRKPPQKPGEKPWWTDYYTDTRRIRDREIFR